jgi:uncharacterized damage-inducible protein DinB
MTADWAAPEVVRTDPPFVADERAMYQAWLDFHRATLLGKCTGLPAAQLKTASAEPSNLTLLGLVRHMAQVERWWFRTSFAGQDVDALYSTDDWPDAEFEDLETADAAVDLATFDDECRLADEAVASAGLDETFLSVRGNVVSLRWVYVHMIEEYARHNGHADLIRERIDGAVGD